MDVSDILDSLNDAQREAVAAPAGNMLVLAGAGCGKTRVLVHRIAWLIRAENVSPFGILAVTFTNKAASEMRGRIENLLEISPSGMWVGTFHSLAHRLLRMHWQDAGLPQAFQIMDSQDQLRVVKRVLKELALDEARWPAKQAQWYINGRKDEGQRPQHIDSGGDPHQETLIRIYQAYEEACQRSGQVDFTELLLRGHELWLKNPEILAHYQQRFRHILVDEFQDTNTIQYAWIRLLAGDSGNVFVVGDDDQSIYGWRGAKIENIHKFQRDCKDVQLVRLEQNYRSTSTILSAANALIANNTNRLGKELWTEGAKGDPIRLYGAFNEIDEARFVVGRIGDWVDQGGARKECALLYRSNAQSRVLEEALLRAGMPYRIYGGQRFFERAEIKDALAYMRLVAYRNDDPSFERVVNVPTRGIGERTVQTVREQARADGVSLWQAAQTLLQNHSLTARAGNALTGFMKLIDDLAPAEELPLHEVAETVVEGSGLIEHYKKEKGERGQSRIENLEELVSAAREFEFDEEEHEGMDELSAFLAHASLEAGDSQASEWEDSVQLMTLHSAKGLEFPMVFLCGVEEGLFPHKMSLEEEGRLEEERRLCYVGMTRAMQQLFICYAEVRRLYGQENSARPSRFIEEIPDEYMEELRIRGTVSQPRFSQRDDFNQDDFNQEETGTGLRLGQVVRHAKFGNGIVTNCEGQGAQARVQVNFESVGRKWLVLAYANLQTV